MLDAMRWPRWPVAWHVRRTMTCWCSTRCPGPRTVTGPVLPGVLKATQTPEDSTAGRHFQDRLDRTRLYAAHDEHEGSYVAPVEVPAFGYTVVDTRPRRQAGEAAGVHRGRRRRK